MITRGRNFLFELIDRQEAWQVLDVSAQHWMEILCRQNVHLRACLVILDIVVVCTCGFRVDFDFFLKNIVNKCISCLLKESYKYFK